MKTAKCCCCSQHAGMNSTGGIVRRVCFFQRYKNFYVCIQSAGAGAALCVGMPRLLLLLLFVVVYICHPKLLLLPTAVVRSSYHPSSNTYSEGTMHPEAVHSLCGLGLHIHHARHGHYKHALSCRSASAHRGEDPRAKMEAWREERDERHQHREVDDVGEPALLSWVGSGLQEMWKIDTSFLFRLRQRDADAKYFVVHP